MKFIKYFIMGVVLFLVGCEGAESEIENNKPEVVWEDDDGATIQVGEQFDFHLFGHGEDEEDGIIPCNFDTNDVNYEATGTYTATCTVTDADGDTATSSITVEVVDETPPTITKLSSHKSVYRINTEIDFMDNICVKDNYSISPTVSVNLDDFDVTTVGTYNIAYTAVDESGNETIEVFEYVLTDRTIPVMTTEIKSFDYDSVLVDYEIEDPSGLLILVEVKVRKEGVVIQADSFFDVFTEIEFEGLQANTQYTIDYKMVYDLGGLIGQVEKVVTKTVTTLSYETPEVLIETISIGETFVLFQVYYDDLDQKITSASLSYFDEMHVKHTLPILYTEVLQVQDLLTNHPYDFTLEYTYDLLDEVGVIHVVTEVTINTQEAQTPEVMVVDEQWAIHQIYLDIEVLESVEYITTDMHITLTDREGSLPKVEMDIAPLEMNQLEFSGLSEGRTYDLRLTYDYDLQDGLGVRSYEFTYETFTHVVEIVSFIVTPNPSVVGNTVIIQLEIENGEMYDILGITLNGVDTNISMVSPGYYELNLDLSYVVGTGESILEITSLHIFNLGDVSYLPMNFNNTVIVIVFDGPI